MAGFLADVAIPVLAVIGAWYLLSLAVLAGWMLLARRRR